MKNNILIAFVVLANAALFLLACNEQEQKEGTKPVPTQAELVKRGEYLVSSIGCDDCHTPKKMGPNGPELILERRLSGRPSNAPLPKLDLKAVNVKDWALFANDLTATVGPWGVSFAANLTSDDTGIGTWTEAQFLKSIREGKSKGLNGTRPLLPPMPWSVYKNMTDEDLRAIFAYLKSTKPVQNVVPAPIPIEALMD